MEARSTTLLVIGGGPGGYVAAIRAGQLGIATTLVEGDKLGGTCLNIGCIPSKALIHAAGQFGEVRLRRIRRSASTLRRRASTRADGAMKEHRHQAHRRRRQAAEKSGVQVVSGWASIIDGKTVEVTSGAGQETLRLVCEHLLLAPGSQAVALPAMPFGGRVISSTEALAPQALPKRLVVVGAGYIGLELGTAYRKLGAEVAVVEALDRVLPAYDDELAKPVAVALRRLGVQLYLGCTVQGLHASGDAVCIRSAQGEESALPADQVLVAVGRWPRTNGWGLETLMLDMNGRAVRIDDQCRTSMRNVWAIGDVTGEPMLAHRAMAQGEMVAEIIAGGRRHFMPAVIPAVCFTDPELVVVGHTPSEAAQSGLDCISTMFPFAANGRALTLESSDGFVRVVARRDNHLIVGWQAVGRGVSELCTAFCHSIEMGERLEDTAGTIHAHPTLGEAVQEAALRALHPLHAQQPRHRNEREPRRRSCVSTPLRCGAGISWRHRKRHSDVGAARFALLSPTCWARQSATSCRAFVRHRTCPAPRSGDRSDRSGGAHSSAALA
jgi:dihydrolipoamide dehydrogenase